MEWKVTSSLGRTTFLVFMCLAWLIPDAMAGGTDEYVGIGISEEGGSAVGMKFLPPYGNGWKVKRGGLSVELEKAATSETGEELLEAYMIRPDNPEISLFDYARSIRNNIQAGIAASKKFAISELDVVEDPSNSKCVRIHLLLQHLQPGTNGQTIWKEQYNSSCRLLNHPGVGFEIRYSHGYTAQTKNSDFPESAKRVLDRVIIEDRSF